MNYIRLHTNSFSRWRETERPEVADVPHLVCFFCSMITWVVEELHKDMSVAAVALSCAMDRLQNTKYVWVYLCWWHQSREVSRCVI